MFDIPASYLHARIPDFDQLWFLFNAPFPNLSSRRILFMDDGPQQSEGRDVFRGLSGNRLQFFDAAGETPETFLALFNAIRQTITQATGIRTPTALTRRNQLLLTLIWLRSYPSYNTLSIIFNITVERISVYIHSLWPVLFQHFLDEIRWPSRAEWTRMRGHWNSLPDVVGCIDGTSFYIYRPASRLQQSYFSGHRHRHCVHAQVIIDNRLNISHIEAGFLGRYNDAQSFRNMPPIGDGLALDSPRNCYIFGDCIYPPAHPIVTPFTRRQVNRQHRRTRRICLRFNDVVRQHRIYVEHVIHLLKMFRVIGTLFRHPRRHIAEIICLCTF